MSSRGSSNSASSDSREEYWKQRKDEFLDLWSTLRNCDFQINCEGGRSFECHLLALAAGSEYFEEQLRAQAKTITITQYSATVIEEIIKFIYTDEIRFNRKPSTVRDILIAAEVFRLRRLDLVDEFGVQFILRETSAIPDTIGLFLDLMQHSQSDRTVLIQSLSRHIVTFFEEFEETEFAQFGIDEWMMLLSQRWYLPAGKESEFLRLLSFSLETQKGRLYLDEVEISRMVFGYYADNYSQWLSKRFATPHIAQAYLWQDTDWQDQLVTYSLPALHVYVREDSSAETQVFSASRTSPRSWTKSPLSMLYYSYEFMANIAKGDYIYRLAYTEKRNIFIGLDSAVNPDIKKLAPPPSTHARFELYSTRDFIYLITFGPPMIKDRNSFTMDSDNVGLYRYKIATDTWFPVCMPTEERYRGAAVTTYNEHVYLIARAKSTDRHLTLYQLQDEDDRLEWIELGQSGLDHYEGKMTCCGHEGSIFVCSSGPNEEPEIEQFVLTSKTWEEVAPFPSDVDHVYRLVSFENWVWVIGKSKEGGSCIVRIYNAYSDTWEPSPFKESIQDVANFKSGRSSLEFVDSFIFKSLGSQA